MGVSAMCSARSGSRSFTVEPDGQWALTVVAGSDHVART